MGPSGTASSTQIRRATHLGMSISAYVRTVHMYVYIYIYQLKHGQLFCNPSGSVTSSRLFLQPISIPTLPSNFADTYCHFSSCSMLFHKLVGTFAFWNPVAFIKSFGKWAAKRRTLSFAPGGTFWRYRTVILSCK